MAPSWLDEQRRRSNSTLLACSRKTWPEDKSTDRSLFFSLPVFHSLCCSRRKNNLLFPKFPPDFSLPGRWIVQLIGIEMPNILMSPCIHTFFTFSPTGHFQLFLGLTVIGSHTLTVRIRKSYHLFAFLPHCPLAAFMLPASCQQKGLLWLHLLQVRWRSISNHEPCPHPSTPPLLPPRCSHQVFQAYVNTQRMI